MDVPQTYIEGNKPLKPRMQPGMWLQRKCGMICFIVEDGDGVLLIIDSTDYQTLDDGFEIHDEIPNDYQYIAVESVVLKVK